MFLRVLTPHTDVNKHKMHFSFIFSIFLNVWGQNAHITNVSGKRAVCIRNSRLLITLSHKITAVPWLHVQWNPVDTVTSGPKKFGRINWWSCYLGGRKAGFRYYLAVGNFYILHLQFTRIGSVKSLRYYTNRNYNGKLKFKSRRHWHVKETLENRLLSPPMSYEWRK